MSAIVLKNVTKRFRRQAVRREYTTFKTELLRWVTRKSKPLPGSQYIEALRGIDLTIPQGRTVGIIGRNGSGKSTLLKIITGIYAPTEGTIDVHGRISALLDLGAGFHPDFTGRENIMVNGIILGMSRHELKGRMDEIIQFSELGDFIDQPVRTYSSGMYMRLAFAVATHVEPEILIIDEILSVGDEHFSKKSLAKMNEFKTRGKTIVVVTHDLSTLKNWCDHVAWVDGGKIRLMGDPGQVIDQYRQAVLAAEAQATATGSSALSTPGGALPEVPVGGQPLVHNAGRLDLSAAKVFTLAGQEVDRVDTEDGLEVRLSYAAHRPQRGVRLAVTLSRDGGLVFGTNTVADGVVLPDPLEGSGTVRLKLQCPASDAWYVGTIRIP